MATAMAEIAHSIQRHTGAESGLLRLATPVLETVLRLRAGAVEPTAEIRQTIAEYLLHLEQAGVHAGYRESQLRDAKFALTAFTDQSASTCKSPFRDQWRVNLLLVEYFGNVKAGDAFFERLQQLLNVALPDAATQPDVDVIEIYYLCLLLGYKGRYLGDDQKELQNIGATTANWLAQAKRLAPSPLAPHGLAADQVGARAKPQLPRWVWIGGGVWLWSLILLGLILNSQLSKELGIAIEKLLR